MTPISPVSSISQTHAKMDQPTFPAKPCDLADARQFAEARRRADAAQKRENGETTEEDCAPESDVIGAALSATLSVGLPGELPAVTDHQIDPDSASVDLSYGLSFSNSPKVIVGQTGSQVQLPPSSTVTANADVLRLEAAATEFTTQLGRLERSGELWASKAQVVLRSSALEGAAMHLTGSGNRIDVVIIPPSAEVAAWLHTHRKRLSEDLARRLNRGIDVRISEAGALAASESTSMGTGEES
ncbi:hypothetical protein [Pandoraea sputorum]|uniref:hypothetical protein n=1 Tax=Pandoraea sputorum TaxID=93222 RepID=UPI002AF6ACF6|nr:hypothetical protein [Pandoraea sputorum]